MSYGEDRVFVENGSAHIRELSQFPVCDSLNAYGIIDDPGICHHKARDICPVLVDVRLAGSRYDRTRDIASAPGKSLDMSVKSSAVKSRNDRSGCLRENLGENLIGLLLVQISLFVKKDHIFGVDKFIAKIAGHDASVEILAP